MDNLIQVGQRVRSYDHQPIEGHIPEMYVEGTVTQVDPDGIVTIDVEKDVTFPSNPRPEVTTNNVGLNFVEWDGRLQVIE